VSNWKRVNEHQCDSAAAAKINWWKPQNLLKLQENDNHGKALGK
jgi:hypothetical protein